MTNEAKIALACKNGAEWLYIRGDSYDEFYGNAVEALGVEVLEFKLSGFRDGAAAPTSTDQAVQNLRDQGVVAPHQQPYEPAQQPLNPGIGQQPAAPSGLPQPPSGPPSPPPGPPAAAPQAPPAAPPQAPPPAPPAAQQAGAYDWKAAAPYCAHGQRRPHEGQFKSGRSAGQTYYAYFCAAPKEATDKCKAIDAVTGKEWS